MKILKSSREGGRNSKIYYYGKFVNIDGCDH